MIRKLLKFIAILLAAVIGLASVGILILTVAEYRPADTEAVTPAGSASEILRQGDTVRVVSWNIGFGALGVLIKNRLRLRREAREAKKNQSKGNLLAVTQITTIASYYGTAVHSHLNIKIQNLNHWILHNYSNFYANI